MYLLNSLFLFSEMAGKHRNPSGESDVDSPPIPPDGGYGWVIMLASFVCNVIVDGVCFSFGIFYLEFLQHYGESKSKTSIVGSVLNGMYLSMGKYFKKFISNCQSNHNICEGM